MVVTFNPAVDFPGNLSSISKQVNKIFVIDNSNDLKSQKVIKELKSEKTEKNSGAGGEGAAGFGP